MAFRSPKTIFQIGRVLTVYFRRKEIVGGKEEEYAGKGRFPFLDQRGHLRYLK